MRRFHSRRAVARAGMTLLEVTLVTSLLAVFGTSMILAIESSARAYGVEAIAARLDANAREALDRITAALREADIDSFSPAPVAAPASSWQVDFQRTTGFAGGAATFGPTERITFVLDREEVADGNDNDGDGLIDEGCVVWIESPPVETHRVVLCTDVAAVFEGEVPGNGLDDNDNGLVDECGFHLEFTGDRVIVRVTLEDVDRDGHPITRSAWRTLTPRNTPED
jgi:hypothetical protein